MDSLDSLELLILNSDRRGISKAITLIESEKPQDCQLGRTLLERLAKHRRSARRIGISGPPGVGKSSFIERLGLQLTEAGKKVAVLAIDPTSPISGGSILGDKTRMEKLSIHPLAFIRPSPSRASASGVSRNTREAILVFEAGGYDYILVETVGVGQAEYACESMVDFFITLHQPGSGDDLQGIKKGILELSQLVVITKSDGDLASQAQLSKADLEHAFHFLPPLVPERKVQLCSSKENTGFNEIVEIISHYFSWYVSTKAQEVRRTQQTKKWFDDEIFLQFNEFLHQSKKVSPIIESYRLRLAGNHAASSLAQQAIEEIVSRYQLR